MATLTYELERGDDLIELELEYEVAPIDPGCGPSWNSPGEPPSGGEVEELSVTLNGEPFELTDAEATKVDEFITEHHDYGEDDDYPEDW